jgi:hypothetical protein
VLHHIAVRPFLEQPAGKNAAPLFLTVIEHKQLNEGTGFRRRFPLRCAFAGPQADDRATDADALPRLERYVTDKTVTLVEQADDGHSLLHRRDAGKGISAFGSRLHLRDGTRVGRRRRRFVSLTIAAGERKCQQRCRRSRGQHRAQVREAPDCHAPSGVQA